MENGETIVLEIFHAMTDEMLVNNSVDKEELHQICSALSLDLQLAREDNYERVIYEA